MQGCDALEIDVYPKRALLELRDGKFWDGEPGRPSRQVVRYLQ
jgi:hypothetical protein